MTHYEYKVIPAPTKGVKAPGVKTAEARFAGTVEAALNAQAADGWEYLRTDILPSDERQGLTGSQTVYRTLMVFRRAKGDAGAAADDVIQTAQDMAEASGPGTSGQKGVQRREPSLTPIKPSRADPAPSPDAPKPEPNAPKPDTPKTPDKD
ncbi:hypothetical protein ACEWPL_009295 [Roseovarius sp. S1116L3]|uniref:DUF4177 domain-containing protein n=1 Tax=Roseovarius roseus TaxID=3342636 RepID=UPI003728F2F0